MLGVSHTVLGLFAGLLLGLAAAVGGVGAFLLAAALGVLGLLVGRYLDGEVDIDALTGRGRSATRS